MFRRAIGGKTGGVATSALAALALLMQLLLAAPCARAEPVQAAAHCEQPAAETRSDPQKAPAASNVCCKCVAALVASPPASGPLVGPSRQAGIACTLASAADVPSLRGIASGPPSQAPPVSI